ncbi:hypothetical protein VTJ49DRAFT_3091 [Mycothermus thermophilus]|uniref:Uncharacterized protein n=1 Tax=Humicola insolens TaxID=85995 RepID=A0ABR3V8K8_HUMIN
MRATRLLAPLWLLSGSLVSAGYDARGPEVEFFYRAYRMDVDISVAEFLADPKNKDKDPNVEKPWHLARHLSQTLNDDADWPKGGKPDKFYGLNFHAWMAGVSQSGKYGRNAARQRIDDPVNPDFKAAFADTKDADGNYLEPRRNIMRLPPDGGWALDPINPDNSFKNDKSEKKWSWTGFDPNGLLGGLNKSKKGNKLGSYFEFDNILGIIANHCSELYKKNPDVGKPHFEAMAEALKHAQLARKMESSKYQTEAARRVLQQYDSDIKRPGTVSGNKNALKTTGKKIVSSNAWFPGWKYDMLDIEKTRKNWPSNLESHKNAIFTEGKYLHKFSQQWAKGDLSYLNDKGKRVLDPGTGDNHNHLQVTKAERRLEMAIREQIKDPNLTPGAPGCDWFKTREPGDGPGDPLKRRMALDMLRDAMSPA